MNKKTVNNSLWLSGLVTGALVGYFLYKNRDNMDGQKEKLKMLQQLFRKRCNGRLHLFIHYPKSI